MYRTWSRCVDSKTVRATKEVASAVHVRGALRVGRLALPGQGTQQLALGMASSGIALRELHSKMSLARGHGCLLAVRERLVEEVAVYAQGTRFILEAANKRAGECTQVLT